MRESWEPKRVRESIVTSSKYQWSMMFSRFYESRHVSGPQLAKDQFIIAVNWKGEDTAAGGGVGGGGCDGGGGSG